MPIFNVVFTWNCKSMCPLYCMSACMCLIEILESLLKQSYQHMEKLSIIIITVSHPAWVCELNNATVNTGTELLLTHWNQFQWLWATLKRTQEISEKKENNLAPVQDLVLIKLKQQLQKQSTCTLQCIHPSNVPVVSRIHFSSPFSLFFLVLSRWSLSMMRTCLSLARSLMKACLSRASVVGRCRWFLTRQRSTNDKKRFDLWKRHRLRKETERSRNKRAWADEIKN